MEAFLGHEVSRRRVAKKGVEEDGVVLSAVCAEEVSSVVDVKVDFCGFEVEEVSRDVCDLRIDFNDVYLNAFFGKLAGDNADAESDDEGGFQFFGVCFCEVVEHVGKDGKALSGVGIVYVLAEEVVEVVAGAVGGFEHLHEAEVGVAAGEFFEVGSVGEGFGADAGKAGGDRNSQR